MAVALISFVAEILLGIISAVFYLNGYIDATFIIAILCSVVVCLVMSLASLIFCSIKVGQCKTSGEKNVKVTGIVFSIIGFLIAVSVFVILLIVALSVKHN